MMVKKGVKEVIDLPLENIRVFESTMTRQTFVSLMKKKIRGGRLSDCEKIEWEDFQELMDSMKAVGQIECVAVREIEGIPKELLEEDGIKGSLYQLLTGLRRFWAAKMLGWEKIKVAIQY